LDVAGLDNFSSGSRTNLVKAVENPRFRLVEGDLSNSDMARKALADCNLIFHMAADPEVQIGSENPLTHFQQNLVTTFNLLEAIRVRKIPTKLVFASTSTVYGEPSLIPTPENYAPLLPISTYGATKLGCEALLASYSQLLPLQVVIFRFANVVGRRTKHGVLYDFIRKLQKNPAELEVLGDGTQTKSYLHIDDCVDAFLKVLDNTFWNKDVDIYNIGTEDKTNVLEIARIIMEAMGLGKVAVRTVPGPGGRGWVGDVKTMQLDISKVKKLGWKPRMSSDEAVRVAAQQLVQELSAWT